MRNFIITVVDGLRADVPGFDRLEPQVSSPDDLDSDLSALESLWEAGTSDSSWYTTHLEPEPALTSLLTGLYPREHGVYGSSEPLSSETKTMVEYFQEEGFRTVLLNGHRTYYSNGLAARFDEAIMGPPQRLFTRIKELNDEGHPVFAVYETLDLREPYLLSKFPPSETYHQTALNEANDLGNAMGIERTFEEKDVQLLTSDWEIPQAGSAELPLWSLLMDVVHGHHRAQNVPLEDPVEHLVRFYARTVKLLSDNHFNSLGKFLDNDESGQRTSVFLTSNSSHGFTEREGHRTFGQRKKPTQDATRVPALFMNMRESPSTQHEITSHIDLLPTVLDDFDIQYDSGRSGRSLYEDSSVHDRIFVESSRSFDRDDTEEDSETDNRGIARRSVLAWSAVINSNGWKLYMRGLPVTEKDLDLPLKEFLWVVMAKVTLTSPDAEELEQRAEDFQENDNPEARKQLLRRLKESSDPQFEFYNWEEDYYETENQLLTERDEQLNEVLDKMVRVLSQRFEDPYHRIKNVSGERQEPEEVDLLAPMKAVGYVE